MTIPTNPTIELKEVVSLTKNRKLVLKKTDDFDFSCENAFDIYFDLFVKISFFEKVFNIFSYPVLILHELLHIIVGLSFMRKVKDVEITSPFTKNFGAYVVFEVEYAKTLLESILINLVPLMILISALILPFLDVYFLIFTVYVFITFKFSLPSKMDIYHVALFKFKKEFENIQEYEAFGRYCVSNNRLKDLLKY